MQPVVSVILVSYNTRELTMRSIASVQASQGFKPGQIEIIVVDNNSKDDTVETLKQQFPEVSIIANQENKGFGGGNNQGVRVAAGTYILLLNTDAFLEPDSLRTLVDILAKHSDISSVGPQYRDQAGTLQQSAGYTPTPLRVMAWMWWLDKLPLIKKLFATPYHIYDLAWYKKAHYPDWLMGACVLLRKAEFAAAGGFDEQIFMYSEEVELYRRLKSATGKRNYFTPKTWITHLGSASTKKANASRLVYELHGIAYLYKKHYPYLLWFIRFVLYTGVMLRLSIFSLIPSRRDAFAEYKKFFTKKV